MTNREHAMNGLTSVILRGYNMQYSVWRKVELTCCMVFRKKLAKITSGFILTVV